MEKHPKNGGFTGLKPCEATQFIPSHSPCWVLHWVGIYPAYYDLDIDISSSLHLYTYQLLPLAPLNEMSKVCQSEHSAKVSVFEIHPLQVAKQMLSCKGGSGTTSMTTTTTTTTTTRVVVLVLLQNTTISTIAERILVVQLARDQDGVHVQKTFPKMYPKKLQRIHFFYFQAFPKRPRRAASVIQF